ncbi:hypothetical protein AVEN_7436-1 [Araneus ventricosus]|uniref:Uncharacterized protein n=1 Tax=Araneus ventricosus TaxID=182803 RepID=A0A4Y2ULS0_ARAVE|nr:hypothetical protein AVEN_7436-1 [Araneus ventricosus]
MSHLQASWEKLKKRHPINLFRPNNRSSPRRRGKLGTVTKEKIVFLDMLGNFAVPQILSVFCSSELSRKYDHMFEQDILRTFDRKRGSSCLPITVPGFESIKRFAFMRQQENRNR